MKIFIVFVKSNSLWGRIISLWYKLILREKLNFNHVFILNGQYKFEINSHKISNNYIDDKKYNLSDRNVKYIELTVDKNKFYNVIEKYSNKKYDYEEIASLAIGLDHIERDYDEKFICSSIIQAILYDLKIIPSFNYILSPNDLYGVLKK